MTIKPTAARGQLAGALVVRDGYHVMLMSTAGTVIRTPVDMIRRAGRLTQGVTVMKLREGERVSTLAPVVESAEVAEVAEVETAEAPVAQDGGPPE
jgi:DNA gyrase subunit A